MLLTAEFGKAFLEWDKKQNSRTKLLWFRPELEADHAKFTFKRFRGHVIGYLTPEGASVIVNWNSDVWDVLFSTDLTPSRSEGRSWRCTLCTRPTQEFESLEDLWADHLFEPIAGWAELRLSPAQAIHLFRLTDCTWADLCFEAADPPKVAAAVILA